MAEAATATTLAYYEKREREVRQQLIEKAPRPVQGIKSVPYPNAYCLFAHELRPELLLKFQSENPKASPVQIKPRIQEESQRRWEELTEKDQQVYTTRLEALRAQQETQRQAHHQAERDFAFLLKDLVAQTTEQNSIVVLKHQVQANNDDDPPKFPPQTRRYPDHEFAITESRIVINWALANTLLLFLDDGMVPRNMITETNIPGVIPHFVDSCWMGSDLVYGYSQKAKRQKLDCLPEAERELQWVRTGYYKVYPPDDDYVPDDDEGVGLNFLGHSLPFSRCSIQRYLQLTRQDIFGSSSTEAQPKIWTKRKFNEPVFTEASVTGQLQAPVTAFINAQGDRVEFWDYDHEDGDDYGSYAILQTHHGRVVIVAVSESHPYVFCNLLEFFNSDGSADMPDLLTASGGDEGKVMDDATLANVLIENILRTAESFLYQQMH